MYNNNNYYIIIIVLLLVLLLLYFFDLFLACVVSMERTYARPDINDKNSCLNNSIQFSPEAK